MFALNYLQFKATPHQKALKGTVVFLCCREPLLLLLLLHSRFLWSDDSTKREI